MQCIVNDKVSQGIGPNKKTAKKIAAEAMLVIMGHEPSVGVSSSFFLSYLQVLGLHRRREAFKGGRQERKCCTTENGC